MIGLVSFVIHQEPQEHAVGLSILAATNGSIAAAVSLFEPAGRPSLELDLELSQVQ